MQHSRPFLFGRIFKNNKAKDSPRVIKNPHYWKIQSGVLDFSIRKRCAYPETFATQTSVGYVAGYAEKSVFKKIPKCRGIEDFKKLADQANRGNAKEFLFFLFEETSGQLHIFRDALCTMPLFFLENDDLFTFSNHFGILTSQQKKTSIIPIDFQGLSENLLELEAANRTIFENLKIITERSRIALSPEGKKLILPKSAPLPATSKNSHDWQKLFQENSEKTISRYREKVDNAKVGFEISGGVDSVTAPLFLSKYYREPLSGYSINLTGKEGQSQQYKYKILENQYKLRVHSVSAAGALPLISQATKKRWQAFYPKREIYYEALLREVKLARRHGVDVMFTGMGGDELFQTDPRESVGFQGKKEVNYRKNLQLPFFFTNFFERKLLQYLPEEQNFPVPRVPYSVLAAHLSRNNIFIENDIWPIAPLGDPELAYFTRGLPIKWRQNKNILKQYLKNKKCPDQLLEESKNENFKNFFENALTKPYFQKLIKKTLQESALQQLNLIDTKNFIRTYQRYLNTGQKPNFTLLYFYSIPAIEITLQATRDLKK